GGSPRNGGASTRRFGNVARTEIRPFAATRSRSFAPASETTRAPPTDSTELGLTFSSSPAGLLASSKAARSATTFSLAPCLFSSLPMLLSAGMVLLKSRSRPIPSVTYMLPWPWQATSDGPIAELPVPSSPYDGRPVSTRRWPLPSMRVTEPECPKQAGPSGPAKQGPAPPAPASATYNPPLGENANPRGLFSQEATTCAPFCAVAGAMPAIISAVAPSTARTRHRISSTPRGQSGPRADPKACPHSLKG